jgi:hypothetical protein
VTGVVIVFGEGVSRVDCGREEEEEEEEGLYLQLETRERGVFPLSSSRLVGE